MARSSSWIHDLLKRLLLRCVVLADPSRGSASSSSTLVLLRRLPHPFLGLLLERRGEFWTFRRSRPSLTTLPVSHRTLPRSEPGADCVASATTSPSQPPSRPILPLDLCCPS
ncbi:hypothetical protein BDY24DRAFT_395700 [Mrakia frigida]|uniref:uncharacterized protein n=1 Tax=Mrakia frigida TaxID=29902 RepID=UPI003FCC050C